MQLKMRRVERVRGLLRKTLEYHVCAKLLCSEEESNVLLLGLKLGEHQFVSYEHDGIDWSRLVRSLINQECTFPTGSLAQSTEVEATIVESAKVLGEAVRGFIENGDSVEQHQTIEL